MINFEEAVKMLTDNIKCENMEKISLLNSFNRVLQDDIYSPIDLPPFDKSDVDGYAVRFKNTEKAKEGNPVVLRIIDKVYPGYSSKFRICQGEAVKIVKGCIVPEGADAIVSKEYTKEDRGRVKVYKCASEKENCCLKGKCIKKDTLVLKKHKILKEEHIKVLASLGIDYVPVYKKPVVGVFSIGDNLSEIGKPLREGKEYNNIPYYLYCRIKALKGFARTYSIVQEDENQIEKVIKEAQMQCDILVSIGELSVVKEVLENNEYNILFSGLKAENNELIMGACKNKKIFIAIERENQNEIKSFDNLIKPVMEYLLNIKL